MSDKRNFDPKTSSDFYESSTRTQITALPMCSQQVPITDRPYPSSDGRIPTALAATNCLPPQQHVLPREYLPLHRQCSRSQIQPQQYYPPGVVPTPQQRECSFPERAAQLSMNTVQTVINDRNQGYSQKPNYLEQPSVITSPHNMIFPVWQHRHQDHFMVQNPRVQQNAEFIQGVTVPFTQPQFSYDVQPHISNITQQGAISQGVQYSRNPAFIQYEEIGDSPIYNNSISREYTVFETTPPICEREPFQVPTRFSQMGHFQMPVESFVDPIHHTNDVNCEVITDVRDGNEAAEYTLTGKQRRRKKRPINSSKDGFNAEEDQPSKRRPRKLESDGERGNIQSGETSTDKQKAVSTCRVLLERTRNNMAFPKGTFLIRYEDLDKPEYAGHIWLVDNHRLLQKYTFDGLYPSNVRVFSRTNRFSGWLYDRPWLYHPLYDVKSVLGKMEKVAIRNHPTRDELLARRNTESRRALETELEQMKVNEKTGASDGGCSDKEHE